MVRKNCKNCGKFFWSYPIRDKKFCSKECHYGAKRTGKYLTCENCGKEYYVSKSKIRRESRFCSKECHYGFKSGNYFECENCGTEFYRQRHEVDKGHTRFCSRKCWYEYGWVTKKCSSCGEDIKRKRSTIPENGNVFCSKKCFGEFSKSGKVVKCCNCGSDIYRRNYKLHNFNHHFCNLDCCSEYHREDLICRGCGNIFEVLKKNKYRKYCSKECAYKDLTLYPKTGELRQRVYQKWRVEGLEDTYIKSLIQQNTGVSANNIPVPIISVKREYLKIQRELKQKKR